MPSLTDAMFRDMKMFVDGRPISSFLESIEVPKLPRRDFERPLDVKLTFNGIRIFPDLNITEQVEDWSACRSPSRAKRRRRQGHRQNVVTRTVPFKGGYMIGHDALLVHPEMAAEFRRKLSERLDRDVANAFSLAFRHDQ